jgi:hemoglobin/transferrin/lactoferrin receptor protein
VAYNSFLTNPDLKPQEGETIEGGAGFDFNNVLQQGDRLKIKGSYWHTDAKDFINLDVIGFGVHGTDFGCLPLAIGGTGDGCFSKYINTPNAELHGTEIEARYDSARFYGGIAYSSITGKDTDTGDFLASLQPDRIILDGGIKVPEFWARFGTRVTFADKFDNVNVATEVRGSYDLVDLYAVFEPTEGPLKGFRLDLGIDNVTDEAYEVVEAKSFEKGVNYKAAITWTKKW